MISVAFVLVLHFQNDPPKSIMAFENKIECLKVEEIYRQDKSLPGGRMICEPLTKLNAPRYTKKEVSQ